MGETFTFHLDVMKFQQERAEALMRSVSRICQGMVEGDIAEFGVFDGASLLMLAVSMSLHQHVDLHLGRREPRVIHAFDTFEGMPLSTTDADMKHPMVLGGHWSQGCMRPGSFTEMLTKARTHWPNIQVHKGLFADTMPQIAHGQKFALVHLDCDLYESTRQVLEYLWSHDCFSDGTILMFDDFLEGRGSFKLGQRKAWNKFIGTRLDFDFTDLGFYARAGWACMIHKG